jgi:hypothetical protein
MIGPTHRVVPADDRSYAVDRVASGMSEAERHIHGAQVSLSLIDPWILQLSGDRYFLFVAG